MNDCWNVKSERHSGQYQSCMKLYGVPLLPPVLSKECREEMQYYKALAKEVEKRLSHIQNGLGDPFETDKDVQDGCIDDSSIITTKITLANSSSTEDSPKSNNEKLKTNDNIQKFAIDLNLHIDTSTENNLTDCGSISISPIIPIELPERDNDCSNLFRQNDRDTELMDLLNTCNSPKRKKEQLLDMEKELQRTGEGFNKETVNVQVDLDKDPISDVFVDIIPKNDISLCSSKSFTGSLLDLQSECAKESEIVQGLVRQRSYTLLEPSPQLMAHLAVESQSKGIAVSSISMSDSVNLSPNHKKRRSWDLETAKEKWSSMAKELKQNNPNVKTTNGSVNGAWHDSKNSFNISQNASPYRSQSAARDRKIVKLHKNRTMSDSIEKDDHKLKNISNVRSITKESPVNKAVMKNGTIKHTMIEGSPKQAHTDSEDRGQKIKELYEKIQKQQLMQMASLKEKQRQEELFLQQIFEEQNNILFKQLKMICPKSPTAIRKAWGEDNKEVKEPIGNSGPVSLSQLNQINKPSVPNSPASITLSKTNEYINQCDDVLKKSRNITNNIKQQPSVIENCTNNSTAKPRPGSPESRNRNKSNSTAVSSRKLNFESTSDYEPMLTDRTNDTLADLNVTFPSDSEDSRTLMPHGTIESSKDTTVLRQNPVQPLNNDIKDVNSTILSSIKNLMPAKKSFAGNISPNPKNCAAATTIVSYAKGYLVRRLMRTERVQSTVQTIRDALLCALQLHQDREGIRGADVDLHRRLIQQITAACYSLHDTFISSTAAERCALIAADRARQRAAAARQSPALRYRQTDVMSRSHSGAFPARSKRPSSAASLMTQSNYETFSGTSVAPNQRRRPWR